MHSSKGLLPTTYSITIERRILALLLTTPDATQKRGNFLDYLFEGVEGYLSIACLSPEKGFSEEVFRMPHQRQAVLDHIPALLGRGNVYFCPQIMEKPVREKASIERSTCIWADLDTCQPDKLLLPPTFVLQTSPGRFQALWCMTGPVAALEAEMISKRIAYYHAGDGADKSGWDLTQLLRVPLTFNYKYGTGPTKPQVEFYQVNPVRYDLEDFDVYPALGDMLEPTDIPFPDAEDIDFDAEHVLEKYRMSLHPDAFLRFSREPKDDWSKALWQLELMCFECGMSKEEVFVVCREAACNKYRRDNKSDSSLWKDVCRCWHTFEMNSKGWTQDAPPDLFDLLSDEERSSAESDITLVDEYVAWAKTLGDAAWAYHEAGGFIILSTLLAGYVRLPTSFGAIVPNLWFMILADTTLTRKTTAMDIAMDIVVEVDTDAVLATDGSIEGLFTSLAVRPGRPSVFLRDEFSGLLEAMAKKDYYAGMMETFTKLYDGKYQKRVLRKETIEVREPVLILFAGGIKNRIQANLSYEHVGSGFLPRFLFVSADSDVTKLKPMGPPRDSTMGKRDYLLARFQALSAHYQRTQQLNVAGRIVDTRVPFDASMTDDAWVRYNRFENDMVQLAMKSTLRELLVPTLDRMAKSTLKMATLIAAARHLTDQVLIEERDLIKAISYTEKWRPHTIDVVSNLDKSSSERKIELIYGAIKRQPGVMKSVIMRTYHLNAKDTDNILMTLEQRQMISRVRQGKSEKLTAIG